MFFNNIYESVGFIKKELRVDESFDLLYRVIEINKKKACMFFIDGFIKDDIMEKIMEFFYSVEDESYLKDAHSFSKNCVPYVEVDLTNDMEKIKMNVLSGVIALIVDGFDKAILIDVRTYPSRETSEPEKNKVLRGSRDGFVETLINNTALIRRRIKDPNFTTKICTVGSSSKTDVVICYMENKVDKKLLSKVLFKIKNAKVESLSMNHQSLVEAIYHYKWYNPFPKIKYTERPDSTAASILEGQIVILVDTSPEALILPTSIFDLLEEADDYYFPPITGTYLRLSRYLITLITLFVTPIWLLAIQNPDFVPEGMKFVLVEKTNVPIIWQLIILEIIIDGMRLAALNTPSSLTTALSIIGAIILSDFAVDSGWFCSEAMLYMAFVIMANYSQPSIELGYCIKFLRMLLLIATAIFNIWGFIGALILIFVLLITNKTVSEKSYLYPLIPFNLKEFVRRVVRVK